VPSIDYYGVRWTYPILEVFHYPPEAVMPVPVRRLALGLLLGGALLAAGAVSAPVARASCDPSYPGFCIQPPSEVGDLDCADISGAWFTVLPPDPHYFDADQDGYGCEWN
jgi:micrococcal nuclease